MVSLDGGSAGKVDDVMATTRWRLCVTMETLSQRSDNMSSVTHAGCLHADVGCVYWACYRCILHLQQYSHRLTVFYFFFDKSMINGMEQDACCSRWHSDDQDVPRFLYRSRGLIVEFTKPITVSHSEARKSRPPLPKFLRLHHLDFYLKAAFH